MSVFSSGLMDDRHISTKFYSLIQNNIGLNIGDGLIFVKCEQSLKQIEYFCFLIYEI